jgi:hypothetical protein
MVLEKLLAAVQIKKIPACYRIRRIDLHILMSVSLLQILILSFHLHLDLPKYCLNSVLSANILYRFVVSLMRV